MSRTEAERVVMPRLMRLPSYEEWVNAIAAALEDAEKRGRDAERVRIKRAWALYWDCSAHPGHAAFGAAIDELEYEPEDND